MSCVGSADEVKRRVLHVFLRTVRAYRRSRGACGNPADRRSAAGVRRVELPHREAVARASAGRVRRARPMDRRNACKPVGLSPGSPRHTGPGPTHAAGPHVRWQTRRRTDRRAQPGRCAQTGRCANAGRAGCGLRAASQHVALRAHAPSRRWRPARTASGCACRFSGWKPGVRRNGRRAGRSNRSCARTARACCRGGAARAAVSRGRGCVARRA